MIEYYIVNKTILLTKRASLLDLARKTLFLKYSVSVRADAKNVLKERANKSVKTGQGKKQGRVKVMTCRIER